MIENAGEQVREQGPEADFPVAQGLDQRLDLLRRAVLRVRNDLQRALGAPAVIRVAVQPGERGVQVPAVDLEAAFLEIGIADVGVIGGEPVQRPPLWGREPDPPAGAPVLSYHHLELVFGGFGEGDKDLAGQGEAARGREESRRPHELSAAVGDPGPGGGGVESLDRDVDQVVVTVGLRVKRGGARVDDGRRRRESEPIPQRGRHASQGAQERPAVRHASNPMSSVVSVVNVRGLDGYVVNATFSPRRMAHSPL